MPSLNCADSTSTVICVGQTCIAPWPRRGFNLTELWFRLGSSQSQSGRGSRPASLKQRFAGRPRPPGGPLRLAPSALSLRRGVTVTVSGIIDSAAAPAGPAEPGQAAVRRLAPCTQPECHSDSHARPTAAAGQGRRTRRHYY